MFFLQLAIKIILSSECNCNTPRFFQLEQSQTSLLWWCIF